MSRGTVKKFLVVTVAYVFTDVLLLSGQPQSLLLKKNGLQLLKEKAFEIILKYGKMKYKAGLRVK